MSLHAKNQAESMECDDVAGRCVWDASPRGRTGIYPRGPSVTMCAWTGTHEALQVRIPPWSVVRRADRSPGEVKPKDIIAILRQYSMAVCFISR